YYQQISSSGNLEPATPQDTAREQEFGITDSVKILVEQSDPQTHTVDKILTDGIHDITNTLTGEYSINQIMQMILETIYRALGGSRVLLCLKDRQSATMRARFGYGDGIEDIIEHFAIPLHAPSDVFQVAFDKNVDIRIENTRDEKIRARIPAWYHQHIGARAFTIFPIIIKQAPIALIYIDSVNDDGVEISDDQLSLLKTLRNQAILALKNLG
ncbi:MAG: GAF domain-containing protein, partial [Gammaproteobacteria bacterium]|nr:GAF domain-containing protein [Gammaproteobacteria bacterium]